MVKYWCKIQYICTVCTVFPWLDSAQLYPLLMRQKWIPQVCLCVCDSPVHLSHPPSHHQIIVIGWFQLSITDWFPELSLKCGKRTTDIVIIFNVNMLNVHM